MGNIEKKKDAGPLEIEKKSKKRKENKTNDLLDIDDAESNMGDDGDLRKKEKKKRKKDSTENNHPSSEKAQIDAELQGPADEADCDLELRKEKRRKHEVLEKELGNDNVLSPGEFSKGEKVVYDEVVHGKSSLDEDMTEMINGIVDANKKNIQREVKKSDAREKKIDKKTKKKNKKKTDRHNSDSDVREVMTEESGKGRSTLQGHKSVDGESHTRTTLKTRDIEDSERSKGKKKKNTKSLDDNSEGPRAKGKSKKVSFSGHVEVFPSSYTHNEKQKSPEDNLVRGKRFTPEEDEIVKDAVLNYIKAYDLGEEGLTMVLNCQSYPGLRNCWKEIGTCIPYRPDTTIYYRAHILFERAEKREWTAEETEFLQKSYEKHGSNWKMVAEELGKHRIHVKDKWRRIKLSNKKGGRWTQDEYQSLYDLVNLDLQMKVASQEKKSKHGMLRDNIPWGAISDKLSTRSDYTCCMKWYGQLTSSLVAENKWSNADDYCLISALYNLDAACVEDVNWDTLLEHRPGDVCRKRWDQMVLHIGHHGSKPFSEQVETLAKRYSPDLAETREAWDSKPVVQ